MPILYDTSLISTAKALRKGMTRQEKHLWYDFLSAHPLRFQRQKTIDHYIADFYCHKARLAVELDGSQHYSPASMAYDAKRAAAFAAQGIQVLRFTNWDVDHHFPSVCEAINHAIEGRLC